MNKQLQKAIELAAYTGDKIIVIDENNDRGTVLISLDEYERMMLGEDKIKNIEDDLTGDDWLDKINREITLGKGVDEEEDGSEEEARIEDDFLPSENVFSDIAPVKEDEPIAEEIEELPEVKESEPESEENLYYYEEPPAMPVVEESKESSGSVDEEKKDFTSVADELKNRHNWEIPKNIKSGAQEVK
jgi:hypothetical protein